jgi:hypothetical protein
LSGFVLNAPLKARDIAVQHNNAVRPADASDIKVGVFSIPLGNLGYGRGGVAKLIV